MDIPSEDYINALKTNKILNNFIDSNNSLELIIHFSPKEIVENSEYQKFITNAKPNRNWLLNEENQYTGLLSAYRRQKHYNHLDSSIFPKLR